MMENEESQRTPENATAVVNLEKPQRSIKLNWEAPEIRPNYYKIEAIPETGKHKFRRCETTQMIFSRLKTFTQYEFQISAIYDDEERHSCRTGQVQTHARLNQAFPAFFQHIKDATIDQRNTSISNTTQLLSARPDAFDKVGNVEMNTLNEEGHEMATVTWDHPSFSGLFDDYEIIQYHVEVFQLSTKIFDHIYKYQKSPKTEKFEIKLGETNTIRIRTKYEELDLEKILTSDFKIYVPSRPTRPLVNWKIDGNTLGITWGSSIGVEKFRFDFKQASDNAVIKMEEGKNDFKKLTFEIDKEVFRGMSYIINVTAIGKLGGTNTTSKGVLLGSDWAPRSPKVSLNSDDIHAVDISWERPDKSPHKYIVKAMNDLSIQQEVSGKRCTIWHLKGGTKYRFNIFAIYADKLDDEYRCTTEEITTDPCPDQCIETSEISQSDDHPDSVLLVNWEKINGATMYKVCITAGEFAIECITKNNHYRAKGLESNTEYSVGISAGNNKGFGEQLSRTCKTAMRVPENITLSSPGSDCVEVHWTGDVTKTYEIRLHNAEDETLIRKKVVDSTQCTFSELAGHMRYYADIVIRGNSSERKRRSDVILTVPPVKKIKTLSSLISEKSISTDVRLDWENDQGSRAYDIEVRTDEKVENLLRVEDVNYHEYRCLKAGNLYEFRLRAVNPVGCGRWSAPKAIQLHNPKRPKEIRVTRDEEKPWKIATIKWDRPEGVSCFKVQIMPSEKGEWIQNENCYTFQLGKPLKKYEITVYSGHGNQIFSEKPRKASFQIGEPQPPCGVTVKLDETCPWHIAHITWTPSPGVEAYKITILPLMTSTIELITEEEPKWKFEGKPGKEYTVRIYAGDGDGFFSSGFAMNTFCLENLKPPEEIEVDLDKEKPWKIASINWDRPKGVTCFKVQITSSETCEWMQNENCYTFKHGKPLTNYEIKVYSGHENQIFSEQPTKATFKTDQVRTIDKESIKTVCNADATEIDVKWKKPDGVDRSKISWRDLFNRGTSGTATCDGSRFKITSANPYNQLEIDLSPISGNDIGMASKITILLKPDITNANVEGAQRFRSVRVNVWASTMDITKTTVTAKAKTGPDGNIIGTSEVTRQKPITVEFDELKPGETYDFFATVERGKFTSSEYDAGSRPIMHEKLQNLRIVEVSGCMMTAEWDHPDIKPIGYGYRCCHSSSNEILRLSRRWLTTNGNKIQISNLVAGNEYVLEVVAQEYEKFQLIIDDDSKTASEIASVCFKTAPEMLRMPSMNHRHSSEKVDIAWNASETADDYQVTLKTFDAETVVERTYQTQVPWYTLDKLKRGTKYAVHVQGRNKAGLGGISHARPFETGKDDYK